MTTAIKKDDLAVALNNQAESTKASLGVLALNFELTEPGQAPDSIMLLPKGPEIIGRDGRHWTLDDPQAILDAFAANRADLPIDQEHATELKAPEGDPAPAVGWIKAMKIVDGAIWGDIDWNQEGTDLVGGKKYRYISPVFLYDRKSTNILQLTSAGLTNKPNLGLPALNRQQAQEEVQMKKIYLKLGLPETASEDQALNAIAALQTDLGIAKNRAETPSLDKFVPRADYDQALNRASTAEQKLTEITQADTEKAINSEIDLALKAGKIAPASKDFYVASCRAEGGLEAFKKFIASAPVIAQASDLDTKSHDEGTALNADQTAIANMFGNSAEDLKKYGQA